MERALILHRNAGMRDYLRRSAGEVEAGFTALLDVALDAAGEDDLPLTLECSTRITRARVTRNRYTVSLGGEAVIHRRDVLTRALDALDAPAEARAWIDRLHRAEHAPDTVIFGLGEGLRRMYVDQRPLVRALELAPARGELAMTSLEWTSAHTPPRRRDYLEEDVTRTLDDARQRLGEAVATIASWSPRAALVRDEGEGDAWATHWLLAPKDLPESRAEILTLASSVGADIAAVSAWFDNVPDGVLRVASLGRTRAGEAHVTLYHGKPQRPPALHEVLPDETKEPDDPSARIAGAVSVHLRSRDGTRAGYLVFALNAPPGTPRPLAAVRDVAVYASRAIDTPFALRVTALVASQTGTTAFERASHAEPALTSLARDAGWSVAGFTVRPAP